MDGAARPVRTEPRSSRATDRALSIRSSASSRVSSITAFSPPAAVPPYWPVGVWGDEIGDAAGDRRPYPSPIASDRLADQRADPLTRDGPGDVAGLQQVEHDD